MSRGPFNQSGDDPGRITWTNVRLSRVLQVAYDFSSDRISGPDWLGTNGYNIVAIVPTGTTVDDFRLMVQNLLSERFDLSAHRETKEVSGYVLEIARNGPKIKPSKDAAALAAQAAETTDAKRNQPGQPLFNGLVVVDQSGFPVPRPGNPIYPPGAGFEATIVVDGRYRATALNETMPNIAAFLALHAGAPVQDETGLKGNYDIHLEYVPAPSIVKVAGDAPPAGGVSSDPGPDVFVAVQSQLGLRLVPKKVPVEMLVVDHAEKVPAQN